MQEDPKRLFVYGSLRPDVNVEMHRKFMASCRLVGEAYFQGINSAMQQILIHQTKGLMFAIDHLQDIKSSEELTHYQEGVVKYPGMVASNEPVNKVKGMLFELPEDKDQSDAMLKQLDIYEGTVEYVSRDETAEYERKLVLVYVPSLDRHLETWTYLWRLPVSKLEVIVHGDYALYQQAKQQS